MNRCCPKLFYILLGLLLLSTGCSDDAGDTCDGLERAAFCVDVLDSMAEKVQPTSITYSVDGGQPQTLETDSCTPDVDCCVFNGEASGMYSIQVLVGQEILTNSFEIAPATDACHIETARIELLLP